MISDFHTWLTWVKGWAAWNYLVTGIGFLMSSWAIFGIYQDYKAKVTQEASEERTPAKKPEKSIWKFIDGINQFLANVSKWYDGLSKRGPLQSMLAIMLFPIYMISVSVLMVAPLFLFIFLIEKIINAIF